MMKDGSYMIGFIVGAVFATAVPWVFEITSTLLEDILFLILMIALIGFVNYVLAYKVLR